MTPFTLTRELMGAPVTAHVICMPNGLQVTVCGGTLPHIGAVSVADPQGNITTQQFPTHKDGVVSERWAKSLSERGFRPCVVTAGIHYDDITREGISAVLEVCGQMLAEVLRRLPNR